MIGLCGTNLSIFTQLKCVLRSNLFMNASTSGHQNKIQHNMLIQLKARHSLCNQVEEKVHAGIGNLPKYLQKSYIVVLYS